MAVKLHDQLIVMQGHLYKLKVFVIYLNIYKIKWQKVEVLHVEVDSNPHPPAAPQQLIHMNWLHFKPEFSGKPDEDVEAHLLKTNDWMTTHDFPEAVKVQRHYPPIGVLSQEHILLFSRPVL